MDGVLMITGGTGSFGHAVLDRFLESPLREIRILSRDEKKQDDMRKHYAHPKLRFYLGDVRDRRTLVGAFRGVDYCFHAAALKQVPSCEFHPMEAVRTNILGTENVISVAVAAGVRRLVCLSTDKAVYPINAMGISKAMMEKVMVAASRNLGPSDTVICGTRYGNVMGSRGSVIPLFARQIRAGRPMTVTDPEMTRFMMTLPEAVDLVLYAFAHGRNGDLFVQQAPASTIRTLTEAMRMVMGVPDHPVHIMGTRHGEKQSESLLSREERTVAEELGDYFRVPPDARDLSYEKYVEEGGVGVLAAADYNSNNTRQLDVTELSAKLQTLPLIKRALRGDAPEEYSPA